MRSYCTKDELMSATGFARSTINSVIGRPEFEKYKIMERPEGSRKTQVCFRYSKEFVEEISRYLWKRYFIKDFDKKLKEVIDEF